MPLTEREAEAATSDGKTSVLTKAEYAAACELIGRSFSGTAEQDPEWSLDWILGPQLPRENVEVRTSLTEFYLSFAVAGNVRSGGAILAAKDADGKLQAVCACRRMRHGKPSALWDAWIFGTHLLSRLTKGKIPRYLTSNEHAPLRKSADKSINRRTKVFFKAMDQLHRQQTSPHWYVAVMAVDPTAQGRGYGGQLMRAVSRMAAADGVRCYLEASGTRNKAFYEHLGYKTVDQRRLSVKETVDLGWPDQEHFYALVRDVETGVEPVPSQSRVLTD